MATKLLATWDVVDGETEINLSAIVEETSSMPTQIFAHINTGKAQLGEFKGVVNLEEFYQFPVWNGIAIPVSACKYVRSDSAKIRYVPSSPGAIDSFLGRIVSTAESLKTELKAVSGSRSYTL